MIVVGKLALIARMIGAVMILHCFISVLLSVHPVSGHELQHPDVDFSGLLSLPHRMVGKAKYPHPFSL